MIAIALAAVALVAPAAADAPPDRLMQVVPGPKRYFYADKAGCPARTAACRRKGYLVAGDLVIASASRNGFTEVVYIAKGGGAPTSGWIETAALRPAAVQPGSWLGKWEGWDASIQIRAGKRPGFVHVSGQATWGSHDPARVRNGGVHVGSLGGEVKLRGSTARYSDGREDTDCSAEMRLLGPYLLVTDNNACGGANVTFTGTYRR